MTPLIGGVEAGGTKFVCAVGTGPDDLRDETRFDTTRPDETLGRIIEFFRAYERRTGERLDAVGIGSFGPVDPDPASPRFGWITSTPKPGWADTDFVGTIRRAFDRPVGFDTDVNAAAVGEHRWGAARDVASFIYLTVGTGIGGGGLIDGRPIHGLIHPEMGHQHIPHDRARDPFEGVCPFHGDCWEGLASGRAIEKRWGRPGVELPPDHEAWTLEADYLGLGLANLVCTLSPQRIVLGGGVMARAEMLPAVRRALQRALGGYLRAPQLDDDGIENFVVAPALGARAGVLGAIELGRASL